MKKFLFVLALSIIAFACSESSDGYSVDGNVTGELDNGTMVFLRKVDEKGQSMDIDTATVDNGKFNFTGTAIAPELHYIFIDKINGYIPVVLENGAINVKTQKDSLAFAKIDGTVQNEVFFEFLEKSRGFSQRAMSMQKDLQQASIARDSATALSLRDEYKELQDEAKKYELDFIKENPDALISVLLLDKVLSTKGASDQEISEMYGKLSEEIKNTSAGKKVKSKLEKSKAVSIGNKAPNFTAPTPSGEELALNDVLGKATILDFWAAWCRPCRAENPNVVNVYNKYKDKGLSILGVSLDRKAEDWKKAIEDDGLTWNHVSNVQYFDEIAKLYNVDAIPATFILDENGVIVAKNLRGPALEQKIAEMLN